MIFKESGRLFILAVFFFIKIKYSFIFYYLIIVSVTSLELNICVSRNQVCYSSNLLSRLSKKTIT